MEVCLCASSHCHGNHELLRHDILLGVITASEASTLLAVDTDRDVYVCHKSCVSTNAEQMRELLSYTSVLVKI